MQKRRRWVVGEYIKNHYTWAKWKEKKKDACQCVDGEMKRPWWWRGDEKKLLINERGGKFSPFFPSIHPSILDPAIPIGRRTNSLIYSLRSLYIICTHTLCPLLPSDRASFHDRSFDDVGVCVGWWRWRHTRRLKHFPSGIVSSNNRFHYYDFHLPSLSLSTLHLVRKNQIDRVDDDVLLPKHHQRKRERERRRRTTPSWQPLIAASSHPLFFSFLSYRFLASFFS